MLFTYRALKANGTAASGTVEAAALPAAIEQLRRQGLTPHRIVPAGKVKRYFRLEDRPPGRFNLQQRGRLIRQIGTLMTAGVTLDKALMLANPESKGGKRSLIIDAAHAALLAGVPLSKALAQAGAGFAVAEIALIRAGEQSGSLAAALSELAASLERQHETRGKIASALVYPAFLLCLAPVSLLIVALVLVPNIAPLFDHSPATMPLALSAMVFLDDELTNRGVVWLGLLCLLLLAARWIATQSLVRSMCRDVLGRLPFIGDLLRRQELARLSFTLAALLSGGVALQSALAHIQNVASQPAGSRGVSKALDAISSGGRLSDALNHVPMFDQPARQLIAAGEESNRLPEMLRFIGISEEKAAERSIERFMTIFTPAMTIAIGLLVGGIVMSVMQAILSINEIAAQ